MVADEVEQSERPPASRFPLYLKGIPPASATDWVPLEDGGLVRPLDRGRLLRLLADGSPDESFRPPFDDGFSHVAESSTGELWAVRSNTVHRLAANGTSLSSQEVPGLATNGLEVLAIQGDGRLLVRHDPEKLDWSIPGVAGSAIGLHRLQADGMFDPGFRPKHGVNTAVGVLPDARLIVFDYESVHLMDANGHPVSGFPKIDILWGAAGGSPRIHLDGSRLLMDAGGLMGILGANALLLDNFPRTALHVTADLVFRRLGPTEAPASARYTTRDLTAQAGRDYVPQSGVIHFAPLESENRSLSIPILVPPDQQLGRSLDLELVVLSSEGFEALPAPRRLTIGEGPTLGTPNLERIERLRDGRVLLGGGRG